MHFQGVTINFNYVRNMYNTLRCEVLHCTMYATGGQLLLVTFDLPDNIKFVLFLPYYPDLAN